MVAAISGAIVGDSIGYAIGRRYGERVLNRVPSRVLKPHHIEKAKTTVGRLGGKAVFVGRFTAALRVLVPGMYGMARMPYRTFATYNLARPPPEEDAGPTATVQEVLRGLPSAAADDAAEPGVLQGFSTAVRAWTDRGLPQEAPC